MNRIAFVAGAFAAATLIAPCTSFAEERAALPVAERETSVRVNSLDLTREADAGLMLQRLQRAAHSVCDAPEVSRPSAAARRAMEACRHEALAEAISLLDAPVVTRLYREGARTQAAYQR